MRTVPACLALVLMLAGGALAAPADPAEVEFFEKKIRPVLVQHCYPCHSTAANKRRGGLLLDTRAGLRRGGDSGPALVPGHPETSRLVQMVRQTGERHMPPKGNLPAATIADLEAWVRRGAPDPREQAAAPVVSTWDEVLRTRRRWWSLQPVRRVVPPAGLSGHPVDRFLRARLEQAGLAPAPEADRYTLVRRLSLVLTGLPPSTDEVEAFVRDIRPDAWERLVDRLLASPHFGERWARHWMDVVRFSETHGNEWNYEVHHAWRYRDYLVRAFNHDVPYDQLVREHVAGDLLPRPRWDHGCNESVIGTAFYRFGEVNHDDCIGLPAIGFDLVDNQLDTLTKAFQATTVACARCHDHKLDAVSMRDYYALLGILRSSRQVSHTLDGPDVNAEVLHRLRGLKAAIRGELAVLWREDARDVARYLPAAAARRAQRPDAVARARGLDPARLERWGAALADTKQPLEDPLTPWRLLAGTAEGPSLTAAWARLADRYAREERERAAFNRAHFQTFADFRSGLAGWQAGGHGLRAGPTRAGEFVLRRDGEAVVQALLPAGCFTHALSERLNGTLRSPVLRRGIKKISFQVLGRHGSALRLVSNNCQLNYKNYRALTTDALTWVTFEPPSDVAALRVYAELMTALDNPKFPDQLSALGGDPTNYRLPWEQVAADPRSCFGITRAVVHACPETPRPGLTHLGPLFAGPAPASPADLAARYAAAIERAVRAWAEDRASEDDVYWLDALLRRGLLANRADATLRLAELTARYRAAEKEVAVPRIAPGLADCGPGFDQPLLLRGDCTRPEEVVPRRFLEVLARPGERFVPAGSGRLALAEALARSDNPLTARVLVNRVWYHLFGAGLVRTVDDFGHLGDLPSHPELLDYLADRFVADGWSVKRLVRSLVLTRAFRLASRPAPTAHVLDPANRLLQHYPARRLEAEAIRDAILAVSGRLDHSLYGRSVQPYRAQANPDRRLFPGPLDGNGRRSVYVKNNLMEAPRFLAVFDLPGGKVTRGRRDVTNVPAQALALLNDPFVLQQAGRWADRLVARPGPTVAARVEGMFRRALGRPPTPGEHARFGHAVSRFAELHGVPVEEVLASRAVWADLAHALFNVKEFIYVP